MVSSSDIDQVICVKDSCRGGGILALAPSEISRRVTAAVEMRMLTHFRDPASVSYRTYDGQQYILSEGSGTVSLSVLSVEYPLGQAHPGLYMGASPCSGIGWVDV